MVEENRLLRSKVRTEVMECECACSGKGKAVAEDRKNGGCLCTLVSEEKPVHDEREEREQKDQIAESDIINHGDPSTGQRQDSCGGGTWSR